MGGYIFLRSTSPVQAADFTIRVITPSDQIKRGGEVQFAISVANTSTSESTGVKYDKRKLELLSVDPGETGPIERQDIADDGNNARMILTASQIVNSTATRRFAVLRFRIIDQTSEVNEQGLGFTQICTLFDVTVSPTPPTATSTRVPTSPRSSVSPTQQATVAPVIPTVTTSFTTSPTTSPSTQPQATPTPISENDDYINQACIPIKVNGPSSDKLDIVIYGGDYAPEQFPLFLNDAQRAVDELTRTNLVNYQSQILNKMNWYVFNNIKVIGNRPLTKDDAQAIVPTQTSCPQDRYLILVNDPFRGGISYFGLGGAVGRGSFDDQNWIISAHEWGHYVGILSDEYNAGGYYPSNCTTEPSDQRPQGDPCPEEVACTDENNPKYIKPCPAWDCSLRSCDALQQQLFPGSGCYPRCGLDLAYRARPQSVMDRSMFYNITDDTRKFNGPSLYSIIKHLEGYK